MWSELEVQCGRVRLLFGVLDDCVRKGRAPVSHLVSQTLLVYCLSFHHSGQYGNFSNRLCFFFFFFKKKNKNKLSVGDDIPAFAGYLPVKVMARLAYSRPSVCHGLCSTCLVPRHGFPARSCLGSFSLACLGHLSLMQIVRHSRMPN